jgi:hypothetical protein
LETSAKNSINVEETFVTMSREIKTRTQKKSTGKDKGDLKFGNGTSLKKEEEDTTGAPSQSSSSKCC